MTKGTRSTSRHAGKTKEQLIEALERLEGAMDAMPVPVFFKDEDGRYLACNPAFETFMGRSKKDVIGKTLADLAPQDRAAIHDKIDADLFAAGGSDVSEFPAHASTDNPREVIFYKSVFGGAEKPKTMVGVLIDITEIRAYEKALQRSEEHWATLFQKSPIPMVLTELGTARILEVNDAWCETWGYLRDEVVGKPTAEISIWHNISDRAPFDAELARRGYVENFEASFLTKDRSPRVARIVAQKVVIDGVEQLLSVVSDVTERHAAEQALAVSETQFRSLIETSIHGIIVHIDLRIVFANEAAAQIFGYRDAEELISIGSYERLIATEDRPHLSELNKMRKSGEPVPSAYTFQAIRKDGQPIWVENRATLIDWQGELAVQAITIDITDRKMAEQALAESEQQFRSLIEGSTQGILIISDNRVVFANERTTQIFRYDTVEALLALDDTLELVAPEDRQRIFDYANARKDNGDAPTSYEFKGLRGDGSTVWMENHTTRITWRGKPATLIFTLDISERKSTAAAIERFVRALEFLPQGIALWDADQRLIYFNRQYREFLGPAGDYLETGGDLEDIHREIAMAGLVDDALGREEEWVANRMQELARPNSERRFRRQGRWYQRVSRRLPDGSLIILTEDIDDMISAEARLHQSQKMEAVGQLTGGIAHDFNNLLAVILGHLELAADGLPANSDTGGLLTKAISATNRGAELVHRLLAFSAKQALNPEVLDLDERLGRTAEMLHRVFDETIEVRINKAQEQLFCKADPGQLETALLNLAINARDAMPDGGTLTIDADQTVVTTDVGDMQPGRYVTLSVSDTGTGMPDSVVEHVFEPFYTTKEQGKGTGLGLSMVYGFVKQSAGHISVDSVLGVGSTFRIHLPRHDAPGKLVEHNVDFDPFGSRNESILLVEDDADLLDMASQLLQSLGYEVHEACDGASACSMLEDGIHVDLLLTDVVLPKGMSGPDIAARAKAINPRIRTLYMSGYNEHPILNDRGDRGPVALISKPFRKAQLASSVREALSGIG